MRGFRLSLKHISSHQDSRMVLASSGNKLFFRLLLQTSLYDEFLFVQRPTLPWRSDVIYVRSIVASTSRSILAYHLPLLRPSEWCTCQMSVFIKQVRWLGAVWSSIVTEFCGCFLPQWKKGDRVKATGLGWAL